MITTPMLFGNWNATSVPVFLLRPARSKIKLAGLFWPARNYSRNTTLTKSWHIHTPSRTEHTFTHHMLWFLPLPTIRETLLLRTVQRQTRTGVRSIPNIRSELVFPNIRSIILAATVVHGRPPLWELRRRIGAAWELHLAATIGRPGAAVDGCVGAALWAGPGAASGSCAGRLSNFPIGATNFVGAAKPLPSRCKRMGAASNSLKCSGRSEI